MLFNAIFVASILAAISGVAAQTGCNEQFPDLSTAKGLNATGKATAQRCEATAKAVPSCAYKCLQDAAQANQCDYWDFGCQCTPDMQNKIRQAVIPCAIQSCPIPTALQIQGAALDICKCAGFPTHTLSLMELVGMSGLPALVMGQMGSNTGASNTSKRAEIWTA